MKKHLLFIFISLFTFQSWGQTLIPNKTSFMASYQWGCNISQIAGNSGSSCSCCWRINFADPTGTPINTVDGICYNKANSSVSGGSYRPGDWITYDLEKVRLLKSIVLIQSQVTRSPATGTLRIQFQTGSSSLGPWTTVMDSSMTVGNVNSNTNCIGSNLGIYSYPINNIASRFWRLFFVSAPTYSGSGNCLQPSSPGPYSYVNSIYDFGEINFY